MAWKSQSVMRFVPHLFLIGALLISGFIGRQWAYETTYRLFLDQRIDDSPRSAATQCFDIEHDRVVPKIVMHDDRAIFRLQIGQDSTVRADVRPASGAGFEVHVRQRGAESVVARAGSAPTSLAVPFPRGTGEIEIVSRGNVTWADLRVERDVRVAGPAAWLALLLASLTWLLAGRSTAPRTVPLVRFQGGGVWRSILGGCATVLISLLALEGALRAVGSRLSPGISAARHDLGEPTEDPRWQQTARYGRRLRPDVDLPSEWRYGDIIRMGFVPQAAGEGRVHRYPFHADSEGFRNAAPRDPIAIAALGDSFTDALTMRREDAWPARLEAALGVAVQNYGTAGFGPQQELRVLKDFALPHRPRVVVLAFFAGNDIRDAEAFESVERGERAPDRGPQGWPIKSIVTRADTWFLMSAFQAATRVRASASNGRANDAGTVRGSPVDDKAPRFSFSRGVFTAEVNGRSMRWALMPPYLNLLNFDEQDLSARRGWTLIQENLIDMQRVSREAGSDFVVAFIPFKSQVYLPLLERTFDRTTLSAALQFYLHDPGGAPDLDRLSRNRLAQNALMARFCERAGIPLLDLTPTLQARTEAGETMYFPDDSHLNEAGEAVVAAALADFLRSRAAFR